MRFYSIVIMSRDDTIALILDKGAKLGLGGLTSVERKIWLISEAEVLCDMEGVDSFLARYRDSLSEVADAFAGVGANEIAEGFQAILACSLELTNDELLQRVNSLVTARVGYDSDSIVRLLTQSHND